MNSFTIHAQVQPSRTMPPHGFWRLAMVVRWVTGLPWEYEHDFQTRPAQSQSRIFGRRVISEAQVDGNKLAIGSSTAALE